MPKLGKEIQNNNKARINMVGAAGGSFLTLSEFSGNIREASISCRKASSIFFRRPFIVHKGYSVNFLTQ